ncbi:MAG: DUF934 domain-containing protein [Pseudomonadota bacterium]
MSDTSKTVIVRDDGFHEEDWAGPITPADDLPANDAPALAIDLAPDADLDALLARMNSAALIRIGFPSFSDGRGFTLARRLRDAGYQGRLRAAGHVIADQYAMARRAGFDEVEISADLARRQPADQWQFRANWRAHSYQSRLRGSGLSLTQIKA